MPVPVAMCAAMFRFLTLHDFVLWYFIGVTACNKFICVVKDIQEVLTYITSF